MDSPRSLRQLGIDCLVKTRRLKQSAPGKSNCLHFGTVDGQPQFGGLLVSFGNLRLTVTFFMRSIICLGDQRRHSISVSYSSVDWTVATQAKRDQIAFIIRTTVAAKLFVVDFKICHGTAQLTSPAISPQHLLTKILIFLLLEPDRGVFFGKVRFTGSSGL